MAVTTPAFEDGTSMEALSDSTVIRLCSAAMVSPTETMISMTSTSVESPMSGTTTVVVSPCTCCALGCAAAAGALAAGARSEEHTSELQSLIRISHDDFCLQ